MVFKSFGKYIWLPTLLATVVIVVNLLLMEKSYTTTLSFIVYVQPQDVPNRFSYDGYYANLSSEFATDDLSVIVNSNAFVEDINKHLAATDDLMRIPLGVNPITLEQKRHRVLVLNITWGNKTELRKIGQATTLALEQDISKYLPSSADNLVITVIDGPTVPISTYPKIAQSLYLLSQLILAILVGIGINYFLFHYLNTCVEDTREVEALGIVVLAKIPPHNEKSSGKHR